MVDHMYGLFIFSRPKHCFNNKPKVIGLRQLLSTGPWISLNDGIVFVNGSILNASSCIIHSASKVKNR